MKKREIFGLTLVLLVAVFFRFNQLNRVPPSPSLDEVSLGWNAYSILQTGADEYGHKFPILLRAYDDWRPALYVYLVAPFVKIFGLSALAVRLPSVLLSFLTILTTYFLIKELFCRSPLAKSCSLVAAILLAMSPWHIYISRLGHEVNAGLTFTLLGIFFFLKFVNSVSRKTIFLLLSTLFWASSFYTYQSLKIFGPLMMVALGLIYWGKLMTFKKETILAGLVGLVLVVPIFKASLTPEAMIRFRGTSVFNPGAHWERFSQQQRTLDLALEKNDAWGVIINREKKRFLSLRLFFENYAAHFRPEWLFKNSSAEPHKIPSLGLLFGWTAPFLLLGFILLFEKGEVDQKARRLIIFWILAGPLPAAIATEAPHVMRAYNLLPVWQIFTSLGFVYFLNKFRKKIKILFIPLLGLIFFSLFSLYQNYFSVFPKEQSGSFQYALSKAIPYVLANQDKYEKIVFSNQDNLYQSYMFFLFYSRYDPKLYQLQGGTVSGGFDKRHRFGKYEFRPIKGEKETKDRALLVGNLSDFPSESAPQETFSLLNGRAVIGAYFFQNDN